MRSRNLPTIDRNARSLTNVPFGDFKRHTQRIEDVEVLRRSEYEPRSLAMDRDVQAFDGLLGASFILSYQAKEREAGQLKQRRKHPFAKYCTQRTENLSSNKARADQNICSYWHGQSQAEKNECLEFDTP